jgi:hypothetical protein
MTEQEQAIADDVSARYGLPVMAGAVKRCPPHTFTWQITGELDKGIRPRERMALYYDQRAHAARLAKASGPAKIKTPREYDHIDRICASMYADGCGPTEIGRIVNLTPKAVRSRLDGMGLRKAREANQ